MMRNEPNMTLVVQVDGSKEKSHQLSKGMVPLISNINSGSQKTIKISMSTMFSGSFSSNKVNTATVTTQIKSTHTTRLLLPVSKQIILMIWTKCSRISLVDSTLNALGVCQYCSSKHLEIFSFFFYVRSGFMLWMASKQPINWQTDKMVSSLFKLTYDRSSLTLFCQK